MKGGSLKGPCGNFKQEGYSGFYWENDLVAAMKKYIPGIKNSNVALSICFMKKVPYQPSPFLEGAACSSCPTHCKFHMDKDGEEVEGELCVPLDGYYNDQKAEAAALENISSVGDFVGVSILPIAILLMIWWIRR